MEEIINNHKPLLIKNNIKLRLPIKFKVVHDELIRSIKEEEEMNLIIKIKSDKKVFCEAINNKGEKCDIEAKYIHINKNKDKVYNNNNSHIQLCWFCGLHLLKPIHT